jgi:hypothetical protein
VGVLAKLVRAILSHRRVASQRRLAIPLPVEDHTSEHSIIVIRFPEENEFY